MGKVVYMDYNATTPLRAEAKEAMVSLWGQPANASSIHHYGRTARMRVEQARTTLLKLIGATGKQLVFTATGTEANHLILNGLDDYQSFVSGIEHVSVLHAREGINTLAVDSNGRVDLAALEAVLQLHSGQNMLVSVMAANNETGVIQPLEEIVAIAHRYGAIVHSDAVQAFGKIPFDMDKLGLDACTISAHKIGGPVGAASLVFNKKLPIKAQIKGGAQEHKFRAGTENVAAICGFEAAAICASDSVSRAQEIARLRAQLESSIVEVAPEAVVPIEGDRLANTTCVTMSGVSSETQLIHFDMADIAVSSGSACSSGRVSSSHVLSAMGVDTARAASTIRVSLGWENTQQDIEQFVTAWRVLYERTADARAAA